MTQVNPGNNPKSGSRDVKDHAPSQVLVSRRTLIIGGGLIGFGLLSGGVALGTDSAGGCFQL